MLARDLDGGEQVYQHLPVLPFEALSRLHLFYQLKLLYGAFALCRYPVAIKEKEKVSGYPHIPHGQHKGWQRLIQYQQAAKGKSREYADYHGPDYQRFGYGVWRWIFHLLIITAQINMIYRLATYACLHYNLIMENYTLKSPTVISLLGVLAKYPDFDRCDAGVLEQKLDIPVADISEEEEGFFMARTDRVIEVVGAMEFLISEGYVSGDIRANKDRFICAGIKMTDKGNSLP